MTETTPYAAQELKPCPFCGTEPHIHISKGTTMSGHYTARIACGSCDNVTQDAWGKTREEALANATKIWNDRHECS